MSCVLISFNVTNIWKMPKMSRTQKLCLLEQDLSCKLPRKKMHSWSMFFPHQILNCFVMRFLHNIRNSRMCLKRKTLTLYQNIVHMIAPLILKKEHNLHSGWFTTYHIMKLQLFMSTSMKTLKRVHLTFQVFN